MATDSTQCPLCNTPNQCAVAIDENAQKCWCQKVEFEQNAVLNAAKIDKKNQCICQQCATKITHLSKEIL